MSNQIGNMDNSIPFSQSKSTKNSIKKSTNSIKNSIIDLQKIYIVDFGSQTVQLIAKQVRLLSVYCEIISRTKFEKEFVINQHSTIGKNVRGIILSGSPCCVSELSKQSFQHWYNFLKNSDIPVLGICYGAQLIGSVYRCKVAVGKTREFGSTEIFLKNNDPILQDFITDSNKLNTNSKLNTSSKSQTVWMSHYEHIILKPISKFVKLIASSESDLTAIFKVKNTKNIPLYGFQFHPEVTHTNKGRQLIRNFLEICDCNFSWRSESIVIDLIKMIQTKVGSRKVIMAISGGVDSTVTASLINKAIGNSLICIFVDNGLLRLNEANEVMETYEQMNLNVVKVDTSKNFLKELENIVDPEKKRKIIGRVFIETFITYLKNSNIDTSNSEYLLAQGTIYPDVIESEQIINGKPIKSHHNVGGLPNNLKMELLEPLRLLFKDEVRVIGKEIGVPESILTRHPFPGPGLAIRIIGNITSDKLRILRQVDNIYISLLKNQGLYHHIWQAGAVLLNVKTTGVMGDAGTYENVIALRAVQSSDGMTANIYHFDCHFLEKVSTEIINKVTGVNRVVYDISSKPPATIEWE